MHVLHFFSAEGIVAKIIVKKGTTITGDLYASTILPEVFSNFKKMTGRSTVRHVMLHHDNAALHTAKWLLNT